MTSPRPLVCVTTAFSATKACASGRRPRRVEVVVQAASRKQSRVGIKPIKVPKNVAVHIDGSHVRVEGPKGELERTVASLVSIAQVDDLIRLQRREDTRVASQQHGLARALVNNMVVGVSEGFTTTLKLIGVGYRSAISDRRIVLSLGFSHPVELDIPEGLTVEVERNTTIRIHGRDKEIVGEFAATIRSKRPPEPYKGKGVRYADEVVRLKEGKKGK